MSKSRSQTTPGSRYKPYPKYKDSGVEWLGSVPDHWIISRMIEHAQVINGYPFDSERFTLDEGVPLVRIRDLFNETTEVNYFGPAPGEAWIDEGDVLVGMDGDFNVARWRGGRALLNQRMSCVRAKKDSDRSFIGYLLPFPLKIINDITYSTTVKHLSSHDVAKILFGCPPSREEQQSIAAFLDRETAKIDALVAKKERLIELLHEKRAALITRAVTKGLDPNVPMKDSGVEWLGMIPAHWEVRRLKHVAPLQGGYAFKSEAFQSEGIPVVRMNNLRRGVLDLTEAAQIAPSECVDAFALNEGDLLLGMSGSLGETGSLGNYAIVRSADLPCQLNQRVGRFRLSNELCTAFLLYFIAAIPFTEPLIADSTGTAQFNISPESVGKVNTGVPPTTEQHAIAAFLDRETARIDPLIAKVRDAIERLKEFRTALISAAVTGKIDVRGETA